MQNAIAEISASSLQEWQAICIKVDQPPLFGSFVIVQHGVQQYLGLVHHIATGPIDNLHQPFPLQRTHDELMRDYPHVQFFLQTIISCLALGHIIDSRIVLQWPPQPPPLHAPVMQASKNIYQELLIDHQYLSMIFYHKNIAHYLDELLLAVLSRVNEQQLLTTPLLEQFVAQFSLLAGNDYRRLKLFLQRVERIFST